MSASRETAAQHVGPQPLRRFLAAFDAVEPLAYEFADCRAALAEEWDQWDRDANGDATIPGSGKQSGIRGFDNSAAHAAGSRRENRVGIGEARRRARRPLRASVRVSLESEPVRDDDGRTRPGGRLCTRGYASVRRR